MKLQFQDQFNSQISSVAVGDIYCLNNSIPEIKLGMKGGGDEMRLVRDEPGETVPGLDAGLTAQVEYFYTSAHSMATSRRRWKPLCRT